ncbi:UNVERIFIED_CONTAM: histidine kinase/DNA gyrase B/HSP90-like ATPase [Acetivibrio alkalicellulosi]
MLIIGVVLWVIAVLILVSDSKSSANKWASMTLFSLGCGPLANWLKNYILPFIELHYPFLLDTALCFNRFLFDLSVYIPPYTLLIFSALYSGIIRFKYVKSQIMFKILLLVPAFVMFLFVPRLPPIPRYTTDVFLLSIWVIPYMFLSFFLLIVAYFKEKNKFIKFERLLTNILIIPSYSVIIGLQTIPYFIPRDTRNFHIGLFVYLIICFVFFSFCGSFMGFAIVFEKKKNIYEKRLFNSGISFLNHSIKNEISKISICADYLKKDLHLSNEKSLETIDIILKSSKHLSCVINRIDLQSRDIVLKNESVLLKDLVDNVLLTSKVYLNEKRINIINSIDKNLNILCDKTHMCEVLNNIISNSIDAINIKGTISIQSFIKKKYNVILIRDDGHGILEDDIKRVTEPFFSTKRGSQSTGLGLYYCKKVVDLHGGFLEIFSNNGLGTEVYIYLPTKRFSNDKINRSV